MVQAKKNLLILQCRSNGEKYDEILQKISEKNDLGITFIHLPCLGRLDSSMVLRSFESGASAVLIRSCRKDKCKYRFGAYSAESVISNTEKILHLLNIESWRLTCENVSEFREGELVRTVKRITKRINETKRVFI